MKRIIIAAAILAAACLPAGIAQAADAPAVTLTLTAQEAAQTVELLDKACIGSGSVRSQFCVVAAHLMNKVGDAAKAAEAAARKPPAPEPGK